MRRTEEIPSHMIMIMDLAPVILVGIERSLLVLTYATDCRRIVGHLLSFCQLSHWFFEFEIFNTLFLPFDELFEQANNYILTGVNKPMIVEHWNI